MTTKTQRLAGSDILVLNWRDIRHPEAGGAEQYMHQIARRWVAAGVRVTWLTSRAAGAASDEVLDGIEVRRAGGPLTVYPRTAARLLRSGRKFAAVVDCQNGIPFFAPLFAGRRVPVIQVIHHVHQDQFSTHFPQPVAMLGRFLEGPISSRVYGNKAIAAVSPSTREELRRQLGFSGPVFIVPNGTGRIPRSIGPRDPDPTIAVVARLVAHKHLDVLLHHVAAARRQLPRLRLDVIGDGPELTALRRLTASLDLNSAVTFYGRQTDEARDAVLGRAWLTASTSEGEGWGCSIIEAAAWGVPCLALEAPGVRDSVIHDRTGWLIKDPEQLPRALVESVNLLTDETSAQQMSDRCRAWARCFTWDRSADLLAGVVAHQMGASRAQQRGQLHRRNARPDITTLASLASDLPNEATRRLRVTDEVMTGEGHTSLLLNGCDEVDALRVLDRLGVNDADLRLGDRYDLLAGPDRLPASLQVTRRRAREELA